MNQQHQHQSTGCLNHTSLYFNMNWIGLRMILKDTPLMLTCCNNETPISVLLFILWIFQLTVWFVHSFKVKDCPRRNPAATYIVYQNKNHIIFVPKYCWCSILTLSYRLKYCVSCVCIFLSVYRELIIAIDRAFSFCLSNKHHFKLIHAPSFITEVCFYMNCFGLLSWTGCIPCEL